MKQINLFELMKEKYQITKPVRLIELFAGIGAQAKALQNLQIRFESYRVVEIDKYAVKSYNAIFGTNFDTSNIVNISAKDLGIVDTDTYEYIMTYSFPCQDLSVAGTRKGMKKGSGTRSGLLWEVERLLKECEELPQILLMENVTEVLGNRNIHDFHQWCSSLERLGYSNYVKNISALEHDIPQTRIRTFMVSILGDYYYEFPQPVPLNKCLKDMLEKNVDKHYFLNRNRIRKLLSIRFQQEILNIEYEGNMVCGVKNGLYIAENSNKGYATAGDGDGIYIERPGKKRGTIQNRKIQTLKTSGHDVAVVLEVSEEKIFCIRRLTPLEFWKLMGFSDEDYHKAAKVNTETQLYKQAGNSIVVSILEAIFKQLFMK